MLHLLHDVRLQGHLFQPNDYVFQAQSKIYQRLHKWKKEQRRVGGALLCEAIIYVAMYVVTYVVIYVATIQL